MTITRRLAFSLRAVFRRAFGAGRGPGPAVSLAAGPEGLRVSARHGDVAVEHHAPGEIATETPGLPSSFLADGKGKKDEPVQLERSPVVTETKTRKTRSQAEVLQRLPCLVAHLIAESLGYFTPEAAANAIAFHTRGEAFFCEWYYDWASKRRSNKRCADLRDTVREVGELALQSAVQRRRHHRGPMNEFTQALALVRHVRQGGEGPLYASWF